MSVREATETERHQTLLNNFIEWGKLLTMEQYLYREEQLRNITKERLKCWILCNDNDEIVAQCETYQRDVDISIVPNAKISPGLREIKLSGKCFGVASVFVPPEHRGKGFGKKLIGQLKEILRERSDMSVLYSDIGPKYYADFGWEYCETRDLVLHTPDKVSAQISKDAAICKPIVEAQLDLLLDEFIEDFNQNVTFPAEMANVEEEFDVHVRIRFTRDMMDWYHHRSEIYKSLLGKANRTLNYGFYFGDSPSANNYVLLFHDFKYDTLYILKHRISSTEAIMPLLSACLQEAVNFSIAKVAFWECSETILDLFSSSQSHAVFDGIKFTIGMRKDELSSLLLFTEKLKKRAPAISNAKLASVKWIDNEKYAWV